jgi:hypothetical protein
MSPGGPASAPNVLLGVARLARGRPDGFASFGDTKQAFLASLAPLIAFPLVGGGLLLVEGDGLPALTDMLATFCALLAPPVVSWRLARFWGREALWLRFATAFNWCQWTIPALAALLLLALGILMALGLPNSVAGAMALLGMVGYGIWLHWFLARRGLDLSAGRAVLFVLAVNLVTVAVIIGPRIVMALAYPDQS